MRVLGELDPTGLPSPIPADELQVMLGPNQALCSWDASISKVSEEMARWPFLFSGHHEYKLKKLHGGTSSEIMHYLPEVRLAREWRNKKLAHTDLEMLRTGDASSLPALNTTNIEYGIGAIKDVLTHIADHYDQPRLISISNPWGSKSLVSYLEHSKKLGDMEEASWKDV